MSADDPKTDIGTKSCKVSSSSRKEETLAEAKKRIDRAYQSPIRWSRDRTPGFLRFHSPIHRSAWFEPRSSPGTWPLRRELSDGQPKWQGDLPELARPGTLFL